MLSHRHDDEDELDRRATDDGPPPRRRVGRPSCAGRSSASGCSTLVLALAVAGGAWYLADRYGGNIDRVAGVFDGLDEGTRPAPASPQVAAAEDPVTFLLVGSDTRSQVVDGELPDARSDAIMIARIAGDRQHAQVVSIPRDSWVDIPGHGMNKINAAYAFGGPTLLIQTVENLTGVRIDHYAAISFNGLISMTDALGGVDVVVAATTSNGPYTFQAGPNHLDGDQARWYVGQRYDLAGGDFDRVRRQQNYLRSLFAKLFAAGTFDSPAQIDSVLRTVTGSIAVDDTLDLGSHGVAGGVGTGHQPRGHRLLHRPGPRHRQGGGGQRRLPGPDARGRACGPTCSRTRSPPTPTSSPTRRCRRSPGRAPSGARQQPAPGQHHREEPHRGQALAGLLDQGREVVDQWTEPRQHRGDRGQPDAGGRVQAQPGGDRGARLPPDPAAGHDDHEQAEHAHHEEEQLHVAGGQDPREPDLDQVVRRGALGRG